MRIRTEFRITVLLFAVLLLVVVASVIVTGREVERAGEQERIADDIARGAGELGYLANDYLIYREGQQLKRWQSRFAAFSATVASLRPRRPEHKALFRNIQANQQRLKEVFDSLPPGVTSQSQSPGTALDPAFLQVSWSRMAVQSQALASDASRLARLLRARADRSKQINMIVIFAMMGVFGAYFLVNYLMVQRRTLGSIAMLQASTEVIGSGDLDFVIEVKRDDEIGDLSRAFNRMTTDLKAVTASKSDLEKEIAEREHAERALRESEQRWATTLASIGDAVIATDVEGRIGFMNAVAEALTGWTLREAAGKPVAEVFSIINEGTRQAVESPVARVLREGMVVGLANHTVLVRKDGTEVPVDDSGAPIRDARGKTMGVVLVFRDITERNRVEAERDMAAGFLNVLNESATKERLIDAAVGFFQKKSGCEAVGIRLREGDDYPYYEARGFPREFLLAESHLCARDEAGRALRDSLGYPIMECMCGNVIQGRFDPSKPFFSPKGTFWTNCTTELLATSTEEDRQSRTRNRCNGEGYESVALIPLRTGGETLGLLQLNDREKGCFSPQLIGLWERLAEYLSVALGKAEADEALKKARDDLEIRVEERTTELREAFNRLTRETAEREQVEAQLRQAQKMEAVGTLTGGIAHDFNNILAAIIGFTEIAKDRMPAESKVQRQLARVLEAGIKGRDLVRHMLIFSRQTEQEKKPLPLSSIVKETTKLLRASIPSTVDIRVDVKSESGYVFADPTQMQQVVMNLCTNAAYAMRGKGGSLYVELSDFGVPPSDGNRHNIKPGFYMRLIVRDTGTGIAPEIVDKIFDPFFTTKKPGEGTGLGLSVVHGIVRQHDGYITVESERGKGSTFTVYLPKVPEDAPAGAATEDTVPAGHERVLFVDDEEAITEMGRDLLEELGYRVTAITGSVEALATLKADPGAYDLMITDQTMPRMTGVDLATEALSIRPDMPVILCTGFSHVVDADQAKAAGVQAFAMKPLTKREIAKTIRKVLDG